MIIIFIASLVFIVYTYIGYPFYLSVLKQICCLHVNKCSNDLSISVVIAANNEEKNISNRIYDILKQNWSVDTLQIIVVSDGSTDNTESILHAMLFDNLKVISMCNKIGKAGAINAGVEAAIGDIVIFTDARQVFAPGAIDQLMRNFSDPRIGCVSGELVFVENTESLIRAEIGAYWKYEKWIRKSESASGSVIGATGAIYAIRRCLYKPLPLGALLDDVLTPMNIVLQGYRCIFDSTAVAYDVISKDMEQEWRRKVRTLAGNWQLLSLSQQLFLPFMNPVWMRFISHKICRLLAPFALISLMVSSILSNNIFAKEVMMCQFVFYTIAVTAYLIPDLRKYRIANIAYFFVCMNCAVLVGFYWWVTGRCDTTWQPVYK